MKIASIYFIYLCFSRQSRAAGAVGQPATWEASVQLVRKGGTVNFFGGCPSGTSVQLDTSLIHYSNLRLLASFHHTPRAIREALRLIEEKVVPASLFVDGECLLEDLPNLFRSMSEGNKAVKTLVRVKTSQAGEEEGPRNW